MNSLLWVCLWGFPQQRKAEKKKQQQYNIHNTALDWIDFVSDCVGFIQHQQRKNGKMEKQMRKKRKEENKLFFCIWEAREVY